MSFKTFFSKQARKPSGMFGRLVMSKIFDLGNEFLNSFVFDLLVSGSNDRILEIGCGTGKLLNKLANTTNGDYFEGIDFSTTMVTLASKRNKKHLNNGKVRITEGDFDAHLFDEDLFDKVFTVNTIYFWEDPQKTAQKAASVLKPGGSFIVAFEDHKQLEQRNLNKDVFSIYTPEDVQSLLIDAGFSSEVRIESKSKGNLTFHCVVAVK